MARSSHGLERAAPPKVLASPPPGVVSSLTNVTKSVPRCDALDLTTKIDMVYNTCNRWETRRAGHDVLPEHPPGARTGAIGPAPAGRKEDAIERMERQDLRGVPDPEVRRLARQGRPGPGRRPGGRRRESGAPAVRVSSPGRSSVSTNHLKGV